MSEVILRQKAASEFHEILDRNLSTLSRRKEGGLIDPDTAHLLEKKANTLRHQIRQLRESGDDAIDDLICGLSLACAEFGSAVERTAKTEVSSH